MAKRHADATDALVSLLPELAVAIYESGPHAEGHLATGERLTTRQMRAVLFLARHAPSTMSDLATGLDIGRAAASEMVDRLVEKGVALRETDPDDRRVVRVRLAPWACAYAEGALAAWRARRRRSRAAPKARPGHARLVSAHPRAPGGRADGSECRVSAAANDDAGDARRADAGGPGARSPWAVLALRIVPESKNPTAVETLDLPGVGLISASLFCLTFALVEGQSYGWISAKILGLFAAAAIGLALFYLRERRVHQPLVDFSLFRHINFLAGNVTGFMLSAAMMGVFFTIPIFLQTVLGFSALKAGLVMSPMSVVIIFAAPAAGWLSDRLGSRWIVATGMFLLGFGIAWMAGLTPFHEALTPDTSSLDLLFPFIVAGVGIGLGVAPVTSAVMATAPIDRVGNASGVLSTMRQVGSLMGIAILGAVLQNRIIANVTEGIQAVAGMPEAAMRAVLDGLDSGGTGMSMPKGGSEMPEVTRQMMETLFQTWFTDAINTTFVVGVAFCLVGGLCALLLRGHVSAEAEHVAGPGDAIRPSPAPRQGEEAACDESQRTGRGIIQVSEEEP